MPLGRAIWLISPCCFVHKYELTALPLSELEKVAHEKEGISTLHCTTVSLYLYFALLSYYMGFVAIK